MTIFDNKEALKMGLYKRAQRNVGNWKEDALFTLWLSMLGLPYGR